MWQSYSSLSTSRAARDGHQSTRGHCTQSPTHNIHEKSHIQAQGLRTRPILICGHSKSDQASSSSGRGKQPADERRMHNRGPGPTLRPLWWVYRFGPQTDGRIGSTCLTCVSILPILIGFYI